MEFRTEIIVEKSLFQFTNQSKVLTVGSCFAEVIGGFLLENKITALSNPFGTVFNPISLINLLELAIFKSEVNDEMFLERDSVWYHYDFHSQFFADSKEELKQILKLKIEEVNLFLQNTDFLVLTLGTAIIYELKSNQMVVNNCHKIPANHFEKRLLTFEEINEKLKHFLRNFHTIYPNIKVIFSVSPVRHLKETLVLNSVSKSILRTITHLLSKDYIEYFPTFEIMNDDLRDYRFYKDDLLHPSHFAEKYIINKFQDSYFDNDLKKQIAEWQKIRLSLNHITPNEQSFRHQKHLKGVLTKLNEFNKTADVSKEIKELETKMTSI